MNALQGQVLREHAEGMDFETPQDAEAYADWLISQMEREEAYLEDVANNPWRHRG